MPGLLLPVAGTLALGPTFGAAVLVLGALFGLTVWRRPAWIGRLGWPPRLDELTTPWAIGRTFLVAMALLCLVALVVTLALPSPVGKGRAADGSARGPAPSASTRTSAPATPRPAVPARAPSPGRRALMARPMTLPLKAPPGGRAQDTRTP